MKSVRIRQLVVGGVALALVAALLHVNASLARAKDGGALVGIEGSLTAVDLTAATVTIRTRRGQFAVIATSAATKIERNDRRATLAAFKLGDRVEAKFASSTGNVALKVEAVGP